jgi:hypothetical protein
MDACYSDAEGTCYWVTRTLCSDCQSKGVLA